MVVRPFAGVDAPSKRLLYSRRNLKEKFATITIGSFHCFFIFPLEEMNYQDNINDIVYPKSYIRFHAQDMLDCYVKKLQAKKSALCQRERGAPK